MIRVNKSINVHVDQLIQKKVKPIMHYNCCVDHFIICAFVHVWKLQKIRTPRERLEVKSNQHMEGKRKVRMYVQYEMHTGKHKLYRWAGNNMVSENKIYITWSTCIAFSLDHNNKSNRASDKYPILENNLLIINNYG